MKTSRTLAPVGAALLLALLAPLGADARPPQPAGSATATGVVVGPAAEHRRRPAGHLAAHVGAEARTRGPHIRGPGSDRERGQCRRARPGRRSISSASAAGRSPIGGAPVSLAAHDSGGFGVRIRLPRTLRDGSYALVACVRRAGRSGALGCVTAERHLQIGSQSASRAPARPRVRRARRARPARIRCRRSARTSIRRPATAATRASTPTSS